MNEMGLKKGLLREVKEKRKEEDRQRQLRAKHNVNDDVLVVEKTNGAKFIIRLLVGFIKTVASVLMILLCAIGLISLIYPNTRSELMMVLENVLSETLSMFGL